MATANPITMSTGQKDLTRRTVLAAFAAPLAMSHAIKVFPVALRKEPTSPSPTVLPFVVDASKEERATGANPRCFWHVAPTGNYGADCATGAEYAALATDYMVAARSPHLLPWVVIDMISMRRPHSGIEVGFLSAFGRLAVQARAQSTLVNGVAA
jgi:hypothetical protein